MRTTAQLPEKAALWRYIGAWLGGSAAVVAALALALDGGGAAMTVGALLGAFSAACVYGLARELMSRPT